MKGHPKQDLVHDIAVPNELWHRRLAHVHYRALPWKLQEQCFMIKIFPCIYGKKLLEQRCMYRTILHTEYSRTRHLKKSFPARN